MINTSRFAFFGTSHFSVEVLETLKRHAFLPKLIITVPDKPVGRKALLTPPPIKVWAEQNNIPVIQPRDIKGEDFLILLKEKGGKEEWDIFIVAAYGKIIPSSIIDLPKHSTLNVHPSLLPQFRGATPIESAITTSTETGVTIIRLDEKMDHGGIVLQEKLNGVWPQDAETSSKILATLGGEMLARSIPAWVDNKIQEVPQEENKATYTKKIETKDGELNLDDKGDRNWKKYLAYRGSIGVYFLTKRNQKNIRVIVTEALLVEGQFVIKKVKPEGKKEMGFDDFKRGEKTNS